MDFSYPELMDGTILKERLQLIFAWYQGMFDAKTGRLAYIYYPEQDLLVHDHSVIRDIASIWDVELLSAFLKRTELQPLIDRSLAYYCDCLMRMRDFLIFNSTALGEPSSIAHSAFMLLALAYSHNPARVEKIHLLADGIVAQQRKADGSYKICFGVESDDGLELYPGEAMLALIEAFCLTKEPRYLQSIERGFFHYFSLYEKGVIAPDLLVFFANWQSQYGYLLFHNSKNEELRGTLKQFLFRLHDRIESLGFYSSIQKHPDRPSTVEVACAVEGLADAYALAVFENDKHCANYQDCLRIGLSYLLEAQCIDNCVQRESGGFKFSLDNRTQRVDVTGHAASAFMKCLINYSKR